MSKNNAPVARFRLGNVEASIFLNEGNGETQFYNTVIKRNYKDGDDWKETNQFGAGDLMNVTKVAGMACSWIMSQ